MTESELIDALRVLPEYLDFLCLPRLDGWGAEFASRQQPDLCDSFTTLLAELRGRRPSDGVLRCLAVSVGMAVFRATAPLTSDAPRSWCHTIIIGMVT